MPLDPALSKFVPPTMFQDVLFLGKQGAAADGKDVSAPDFIGPDEQPRYEIDDTAARIKKPPFQDTLKLDQVIDHPELFKAYPDMADIDVDYDQRLENGAQYDKEKNKITLGPTAYTSGDLTSLLLHEIQHGIQNKEGWVGGANPQALMRDNGMSWSNAVKTYMANQGEREARDVQDRYGKRKSGEDVDAPALAGFLKLDGKR